MNNTIKQIQTDSYLQPVSTTAHVETLIQPILPGMLIRFTLLLCLGIASSMAAIQIVEFAVREQAFGPAMAAMIAFYCAGLGTYLLLNGKRSARI